MPGKLDRRFKVAGRRSFSPSASQAPCVATILHWAHEKLSKLCWFYGRFHNHSRHVNVWTPFPIRLDVSLQTTTWKIWLIQHDSNLQHLCFAQRASVSHVRRAAFFRVRGRSRLTEEESSSTRRERMKFISVDKHNAHESGHWFNVTGTESPGQIHLLSPALEKHLLTADLCEAHRCWGGAVRDTVAQPVLACPGVWALHQETACYLTVDLRNSIQRMNGAGLPLVHTSKSRMCHLVISFNKIKQINYPNIQPNHPNGTMANYHCRIQACWLFGVRPTAGMLSWPMASRLQHKFGLKARC